MSQIYKNSRAGVGHNNLIKQFTGENFSTMKILTILLITIAGVLSAAAQQSENTTELQRGEMKKLERLAGRWKGAGWIMQGKEKFTFAGTETVQKKLDGLALLVEGDYKTPQGKVIHETLAVIFFDNKAKDFRFKTYLANGSSGDHQFNVVENGWQWGFTFPTGAIRYHIKIENDQWIEIGERSSDGKEWTKFFEMTLDKVK